MSNNIMLLAEMRSLLRKEYSARPDITTLDRDVAVLRVSDLDPGDALDFVGRLESRVAEEGGKLEKGMEPVGGGITVRAVFDLRPR